jgi:proteasome accessory factor B
VRGPLRLPGSDDAGSADPGLDGDELEIDLRSVETVARWVTSYAPDAVVLDPPELAAAVRRGWAHVLAAHADPAAGPR